MTQQTSGSIHQKKKKNLHYRQYYYNLLVRANRRGLVDLDLTPPGRGTLTTFTVLAFVTPTAAAVVAAVVAVAVAVAVDVDADAPDVDDDEAAPGV